MKIRNLILAGRRTAALGAALALPATGAHTTNPDATKTTQLHAADRQEAIKSYTALPRSGSRAVRGRIPR